MVLIWLALQATVGLPSLPVVPATTTCRVVDVAPEKAPPSGAGMLFAVCGTHGAPLGPASQYSTRVNPATGSVLVVRRRAGRNEVLLASPVAGGKAVHVDDLTRDLAHLGGRSGDVGLAGLTVDATQFVKDGSLSVKNGTLANKIDLTGYATRAAASLVNSAMDVVLPPASPTGTVKDK